MPTNYLQQPFNISNVFNANITIPCQDQYVGEFTNGQFTANQRIDIDYVLRNNVPEINNALREERIVVILESPHKDEFSTQNGQPTARGPAQGKTGTLFNKHFGNIFSASQSYQQWNIQSTTIYDVILMNAVQFQCSLGKSLTDDQNKKDRDTNWLVCLNNPVIQNDLLKRITALNPTILVNMCTVGFANLQAVLSFVLYRNINMNILYTFGRHPSTWWNSRYQIII